MCLPKTQKRGGEGSSKASAIYKHFIYEESTSSNTISSAFKERKSWDIDRKKWPQAQAQWKLLADMHTAKMYTGNSPWFHPEAKTPKEGKKGGETERKNKNKYKKQTMPIKSIYSLTDLFGFFLFKILGHQTMSILHKDNISKYYILE